MNITNKILLILIPLLGFGNLVLADEPKGFATFTFENDVFAGDDDGYTNGISYSWGYAGFDQFNESNTPGWVRWLSEDLYIDNMPGKRRAITYQVAQGMLTPEDKEATVLQVNDLPYSGFIGWKVSQFAIDDKTVDKLSLTLGMVGPVTLAEQTQKEVHELIGDDVPQGWDNQLENEPVFKLGISRKWRVLDGSFSESVNYDTVSFVEAGVGNIASHLDVGVSFRFGTQLARTFPAVTVLPGREVNPLVGTERRTYYFFINAIGRYMANSIFIDGNTFRDSHSATLEHGQNIYVTGVSVSFGGWSLLLSVADQSKAFKEAPKDRSKFGSLSISWGL